KAATSRCVSRRPSPGATRSRVSASPDRAGDLDDALELAPLLFLGERVAVVRAREAALRRQAQVLERDEARGLLDPALEHVLRLEFAGLRGDEAEHDALAGRQRLQRLES